MKILVSHNGLYRKNGWGRTFELARGMASCGNEVVVLCSGKGKCKFYDAFVEHNVRVYVCYDIVPAGILGSGYGLISLLCRMIYALFHRFDIAHADAHRIASYWPCAVNRWAHKSKLVIEWWDNFEEKAREHKPDNWLRKKMQDIDIKQEINTKRKADGCVVLSRLLYERAINLHIPACKIKLIYGGCDVDHIKHWPLNTNKETLGIAKTDLVLGFIGMGDAEYDDMRHFFEAINEIADKLNVKLLNFGKPFQKPLHDLPALKNSVVECGWLNYYEDTSLLAAADVFVLLKQDNIINNSGWPTKFGDYLATGRNVLVNLYGELIAFVNDNKVSVIETNNTKEDIIKNISVIAKNRALLERTDGNNRKVAERNSWYERSQELLSFYNCINIGNENQASVL